MIKPENKKTQVFKYINSYSILCSFILLSAFYEFTLKHENAIDSKRSIFNLMRSPIIEYFDVPLAEITPVSVRITEYVSLPSVFPIEVFFSSLSFVAFQTNHPVTGIIFYKIKDYLDGLIDVKIRNCTHPFNKYFYRWTLNGICLFLLLAGISLSLTRNKHKQTSLFVISSQQSTSISLYDFIILYSQIFLSFSVWTYYCFQFTHLLNTSEFTPVTYIRDNFLEHNRFCYVVLFLWKYFNPHFLIQTILLFHLDSELSNYIQKIKLAGFAILVILAVVTHCVYKFTVHSLTNIDALERLYKTM